MFFLYINLQLNLRERK